MRKTAVRNCKTTVNLLSLILAGLIGLYLLGASACQSGNLESDASGSPTLMTTAAPTDAVTSATTEPADTTAASSSGISTETGAAPGALLNPLTGEPLLRPESAGQRPVAVMINNIKKALPQIGVSQADLIYEMEVEGGITRLMAVFADVAAIPELGSIRSARHNYIDYAGGLDAVLVHIGASYAAVEQFASQDATHIELGNYPAAYWRDAAWQKERGKEHSVKTSGEKLTALWADGSFRTTLRDGQKPAFRFNGDFQAAAGSDANQITVPYSNYVTATFTYNAERRQYAKGEFGAAQIDQATGEPLRFTNVFLLQTTISSYEGTILRNADLSGGQGFYLSGGRYQPITWRKGAAADPFVFTRADGSELTVNTGKSYIGIISSSRAIRFDS
ncbi:MAG: DUF3048 domain-containing protein [Clostridiaceae bacterium]|nr:DUF3048 domain-containing protein [Clostridiaceae bacterium]